MTPLPCPFCGHPSDLSDEDTLYPSGAGWREEHGIRSYCSFREVPKEQWCWKMHCPESSGGCGADVFGHSREEALAKWNTRPERKAALLWAAELIERAAPHMSSEDAELECKAIASKLRTEAEKL